MPYVNNNLILFKSNNLNIRFHPNQNMFGSAFGNLYELLHTDEYTVLKEDIRYNVKNLYAEISISIENLNNLYPNLKEFLKEQFELNIDELMEYEEFKDLNMLTFDFPEFKELNIHIINEENKSKLESLEKFENNSSNIFSELIKEGKIEVSYLEDIHKRLIAEGKNFEI